MEDAVEGMVLFGRQKIAERQEHHVDVDLRILLSKGEQELGGEGGAELAGRGDGQRAGDVAVRLGDGRLGTFAAFLDALGVVEEFGAGVGEQHFAALAHEKGGAERILQLADLVAERRFRQAVELRGMRQRLRFRDFQEEIDGFKIHGSSNFLNELSKDERQVAFAWTELIRQDHWTQGWICMTARAGTPPPKRLTEIAAWSDRFVRYP